MSITERTSNKSLNEKNLYHRDYYEKNKEELKEYFRKYHKRYREKNRDKVNAYYRDYYKKNRDKYTAAQRKYLDNNKDKIKEYYKTYNKRFREQNKEVINALSEARKLERIEEKHNMPYNLSNKNQVYQCNVHLLKDKRNKQMQEIKSKIKEDRDYSFEELFDIIIKNKDTNKKKKIKT